MRPSFKERSVWLCSFFYAIVVTTASPPSSFAANSAAPKPSRSAALDSVGGVGNTTDITIQLELTKEVSLQILKQISSIDLFESSGRADVERLYLACRDTMYRGAVRTGFRIVDDIPDGKNYHALAHRPNAQEIWISRPEIDKLAASGTLTSSLLTMVFLHEVTHDCIMDGNPVDDAQDLLINQMTIELVKAAKMMSDGNFRDLEFVTRVQENKAVGFEQLSLETRRQLSGTYINYVGDWLYNRYRDRFRYRPAPASDFYATEETSVYPGWHSLHRAVTQTNPEMEAIVFGILRASFEERSLAFYRDYNRSPLPTRLSCRSQFNTLENLTYAQCELLISWATVNAPQIQEFQQVLLFDLDSLGRVAVQKIRFL